MPWKRDGLLYFAWPRWNALSRYMPRAFKTRHTRARPASNSDCASAVEGEFRDECQLSARRRAYRRRHRRVGPARYRRAGMKAPGSATIKGTTQVTAAVQEIDPGTRTVLLRTSNGRIVEVEVGEEARNVDPLEVGDVVTAVYHES
jgi:hypothetical protein